MVRFFQALVFAVSIVLAVVHASAQTQVPLPAFPYIYPGSIATSSPFTATPMSQPTSRFKSLLTSSALSTAPDYFGQSYSLTPVSNPPPCWDGFAAQCNMIVDENTNGYGATTPGVGYGAEVQNFPIAPLPGEPAQELMLCVRTDPTGSPSFVYEGGWICAIGPTPTPTPTPTPMFAATVVSAQLVNPEGSAAPVTSLLPSTTYGISFKYTVTSVPPTGLSTSVTINSNGVAVFTGSVSGNNLALGDHTLNLYFTTPAAKNAQIPNPNSTASDPLSITVGINLDQSLQETNLSDNYQVIGATVLEPLDLVISKIELQDSTGTSLTTDSKNNVIIGTTTSPTSTPAPVKTPSQVRAVVTVLKSGSSLSTTPTQSVLTLKYKGSTLVSQPYDLALLSQGLNTISTSFTPPTDPNMLGTDFIQATLPYPLTSSYSPLQYSSSQFSLGVNIMILCDARALLAEKGRTIPFHSQLVLPWAPQTYGIAALSSDPNPTMAKYGCSVTDLDMLMESYGIKNTPKGSPANPLSTSDGLRGEALSPGTLNFAMANYRTNFIQRRSVGFDDQNNPDWVGVATIGKATGAVMSYVSYSDDSAGIAEPQAIQNSQQELCAGNPIIMKFSGIPVYNTKKKKMVTPQHFMLATAIVLGTDNNQHLRFNNPGSVNGQNQLYAAVQAKYPKIRGQVVYHTLPDPSMLYISGSDNIHFVVKDPMGRRSGFDPVANVTYNEMPGTTYTDQSIDAPADDGATPEQLSSERLFISNGDIVDGTYNIRVFSTQGGSYTLSSMSYDANGIPNDQTDFSGTLTAGQSTTLAIKHSTSPIQIETAKLSVSNYMIWNRRRGDLKHAAFVVTGKLVPNDGSALTLSDSFNVRIGGISGFTYSLPASYFAQHKLGSRTYWTYEGALGAIVIDSTGTVDALLSNVDLSNVDSNKFNLLGLSIGGYNGSTALVLRSDRNGISLNGDHDRKCSERLGGK